MNEPNVVTKVFEAIGAASMCWIDGPKGTFDEANANKIANGLVKDIFGDKSFSWALLQLQAGKKVCRSNWNAKNQYVYMVPENTYPAVTPIAEAEFGQMVPYNAYLAIKTVQNTVAPWVPSQTDVLAKDWEIAPDNVQVEGIVAGNGLV